MRNNRTWLTVLVVSITSSFFGCNRDSTASNGGSTIEQPSPKHEGGHPWSPTWDTGPDKTRREKSVLTPTLAFTLPGFRGSPAPQTEHEKDHELKVQKDFAEAFEKARECFGMTLELQNPESGDFGLQLFDSYQRQPNQWRWVLYRMDTLQARAIGETTGAGINDVVKSICSSVHDSITYSGGRVQDQ